MVKLTVTRRPAVENFTESYLEIYVFLDVGLLKHVNEHERFLTDQHKYNTVGLIAEYYKTEKS